VRKRSQKNKFVRKANSKQRNPFEYNPKPQQMKSDEGGVFSLPGVYNTSESYIKGVKAPSHSNIIGAKMKQN